MGRGARFTFGLPIVCTSGVLAMAFYRPNKQLHKKKRLILIPNSIQSTILNIQPTTNPIQKTTNITETVHNATELAWNAPTVLPKVSKQSTDTVTTHGNVHIVRTHTSNAQSTVYIVAGTVATLLLIAVCILALQITKTNKQDVCTDMQQYYTCGTTGASTAMQSNMNTLLH